MTLQKKFSYGVPNKTSGSQLSMSQVWRMWKLIDSLDCLTPHLSGLLITLFLQIASVNLMFS